MANIDAPFGARIIGSNGGTYNGRIERFAIPATDGTATFLGDLVKLAGSATAEGVPTIAQVTAGDTPVGIVVGFEVDGDNLTQQYRPASTLRYALVNTDPNVIFIMQEDSVTSTLAATDVGNNIDVVVGTGSTTSGLSAMELDSDTVDTTATLVVNVLGLSQEPDNAIGDQAVYVCTFNVHQHGSVGTLGL
jgi:hypothetical protein